MSNTSIPAGVTISEEVAAHVLFRLGAGGYEGGSFTQALLLAFGKADGSNFTKLALGFPDYARAILLAAAVPGGIETLQEIVGGKDAA